MSVIPFARLTQDRPLPVEDVRVGRAAGEAEPGVWPVRVERVDGEQDGEVVVAEAIARVLRLDRGLERAVGHAGRERRRVDQLLHDLGDAVVVVRAHLGLERAPLGHDVPCRPAADHADVDGRDVVESPVRHVRDRARSRDDRGATLLRIHPRVRRPAHERQPELLRGR